jgi:outer membrane protein
VNHFPQARRTSNARRPLRPLALARRGACLLSTALVLAGTAMAQGAGGQGAAQGVAKGVAQGAPAGPSAPAVPADIRIGVIHTERILRDSPPARAALARIEQDFKPRDEALRAREQALHADAAQYDKDKPKLAEDERARRERDLETRGRDLERQRQQFAEDLRARQFEELNRLKERLDQVLTRLARDEHYDLILQDALWVGKKVDITDEVIKALAP